MQPAGRLKRAWGALFLLIILSWGGAAAQDAPNVDAPTLYYYANGERIPLAVSSEYVAMQPVALDDDLALEQALVQAGAWQPAALAGQTWVLVPLADGANPAAEASALAAIEGAAAARAGSWVNPVFAYGDDTFILTDEFIAGFPAEMNRAAIDAYNAANGAEIIREMLPNIYLLRATPAANADALTLANRYEEAGTAIYAEPNWWVMFERDDAPIRPAALETTASPEAIDAPNLIPNDTFHLNAWHIHNYAQFLSIVGETADADIDGRAAWDVTTGSDTVRIAVLDDGVQTSHPDLDSKIVAPYDAYGNDNNPEPFDNATTRIYDGHGTAVSGLAAAESNNTLGVVGVCWACMIIPVRIFATDPVTLELLGSIGDTVDGLNHAVNNDAAVINNSWTDAPSTTITTTIRTATQTGRGGLGTVVVISAGNSYQAPVSYPAYLSSAIPGVMSITASTFCDTIKVKSAGTSETPDCTGEATWGNNWGSENTLAAPGHYLPSTDLTGVDGYITGDYVANFGGTSGSAPIVAGVVGLLLSSEPTLTADQVRDRLIRTTDPLHTEGYDLASGWGRLNAEKALNNIVTNTGTPNDYRETAQTITTLPFNTSQSVIGAFTSTNDPEMSCAGSAQTVSNTIWFKFVPAYTMTVSANTFGSNNNTVLAAFDSALTELACNQDFGGGITQSAISFSATGGQTYYFLIGDLTSSSDPIGAFNPAVVSFSVSTSTPQPSFTATIQLDLQGRPTPPDPRWAVPVTYQLQRTGGSLVEANVSADLAGQFTISNLLPGDYTLRIKHAHTLAEVTTFTLSANATVNATELREGDVNNDNAVNITDFSILAAAFGTLSTDVTFDARADLNGDLVININDFSLLAGSFGQAGAAPLS